jgi:hypothetical protein
MALKDKLLYGTYVGLVLDTQDPDELGRVKLIVPGVTGPLFKGWNDKNTDISFTTLNNDTFNPELLDRLLGVLPWARPSMPVWGGGTGAPVNVDTNRATVIPTDNGLSGGYALNGTNGKLDTNDKSKLVPIDGHSGAMAHPIVAAKFKELESLAKKDGINLGITDSYRDYDEQVKLKATKGNLAATPGTSKHGVGLAFDLTGTNGTTQEQAYEWLRTNAPKNGWANYASGYGPDTNGANGTQKEPWHWQINEQDLSKYANLVGPNNNSNAYTGTANPDNRVIADDGVNNTSGTFGNQTPLSTGTSGNCNSTYSGSPIEFSQSQKLASELNQKMDANNLKITVNNGVMDEKSFKAYAAKRLECSPLLSANIDPQEAQRYGITNSKDANQWADFMWRTALAERGGMVSAASDPDSTNDPGGSWGAFSVSQKDTETYGQYKGKTVNDIETNPELSANVAISLVENQITRNNSIAGLDHGVTSQGSFASTTMAGLRGEGSGLSVAKSGRLVQRTTSQGINAYGSLNMSRYGSPVGNFSIPMAGSKVWVVFENGSPQRPIYVGQVYEPSNIQAHS